MLRAVALLLLLSALTIRVEEAHALSFSPDETEWATWPEYCRARYVESAAGRGSEYARDVPSQLSQMWERRMGDAWYGLHHHCAALVYTSRSKRAATPLERKNLLTHAVGEIQYALERTATTNVWHAEMLTRQAVAYDMLGDTQVAFEKLDTAISLHPTYLASYTTKALIYRKRDDLAHAREALESANEASKGESAEIRYALGLVCAEAGDFEAAKEHARVAYGLGHPLPGLRQKLANSGHPIE